MEQKLDPALANWLKILGEPNRLLLLDQIIDGICCNCELGKSLSLSPNLISHHMSVLSESGIVKAERDKEDARWIHYSIDIDVMHEVKTLFTAFFDETRIQPNKSECGPRKS